MKDIITADNGHKTITIKLSGKAYATLQKFADALNEWCDEENRDNTPLTVFDNFFTWELGMLLNTDHETAELVVEGIDTGTDDEAEDQKAKDELYELLHKRGFTTLSEELDAIRKRVA